MNIALLGVSGYQGHYTVKEFGRRSHHVIGVARHATNYHDYECDNLTLYDASGSDYGQIKNIFKEEKIDKVISVYPPDLQHPWTFTSDMKSLIRACKDSYVKQLIMMMGGSCYDGRWGRDPFAYASFGQQITVGNSYYENIHLSRKGAFDKEKELPWVIFAPNHIIKYPERSGKYMAKPGGQGIRYDEHSQLMSDAGVINYWDFACAMIDEAENPNPDFNHQVVSLAWEKAYSDEVTKKSPIMVNK